MILWDGLKVYPRYAEEILLLRPESFEACVMGIPDACTGEGIKAFVVGKPGLEATADEIIAYCKENLVKYKVSKYVEFVHDLPKSVIVKSFARKSDVWSGSRLRRTARGKSRFKGESLGTVLPVPPSSNS